jgi:hypothetical protein
MYKSMAHRGTVRRLLPSEIELYRQHLLRLDPETPRNRFGGAVSDEFIRWYSEPSSSTAFRLAQKLSAELSLFQFGSAVAELEVPRRTPISMVRELVADSTDFAAAMFECTRRA